MAAKGCAITSAAQLGEARHHGRILIVQTFDEHVTPVGLRDDLLMAGQAAQLTLQLGSVMSGGSLSNLNCNTWTRIRYCQRKNINSYTLTIPQCRPRCFPAQTLADVAFRRLDNT